MSPFKPILDFLDQLAKNNDREWFHNHKTEVDEGKKHFEAIVQELLTGMSAFDEQLINTTAKECIYRIYRDVRFSNDKTPYKTNFEALLACDGKKTKNAFYYIKIEPGNKSYIAGGVYMPEGEIIKKIRQEIDYNSKHFRAILGDKEIRKYFGKMEGDQLKRAPKGYSPDDPNIDLLKYKSFILVHNFTDKQVLEPDFLKKCLFMFRLMKPFNDFLNTAME